MRIDIVLGSVMAPNKAWNRVGPPVPSWFRRRLRAIDSSLELQFMPPADPISCGRDGVDRRRHPQGVWVICRRMRRTRFLLKKWVFGIEPDESGRATFHPDILRCIRAARNLWRRGERSRMDDELDRHIQSLSRAEEESSKKRISEAIADTCRRHGFTNEKLGRQVVMRHWRSESCPDQPSSKITSNG